MKKKLTGRKMKRWLLNTLIFSSPALLAFLTALQGTTDFKFALGAGYSSLIGICIDALRKLNEKKK